MMLLCISAILAEFGKEVTESQMGPGQKIEPDWLICPICKNLMFQPVILQSGDSCCDMIKCKLKL